MTDKKLPFNKAQMEKIIEKFPTPFHIYDEKDIRHRARALRQAFSWNEGYKEYYAVKACPNPIIMSILRHEGCGMDCSSYAELMLCEAIGVVAGEHQIVVDVAAVGDGDEAGRLELVGGGEEFV